MWRETKKAVGGKCQGGDKGATLDMVGGAPVVKENSAGPWRLRQSLIRCPAVPVRCFPRERAKVSKFTAR